jgi:hypothetical protein
MKPLPSGDAKPAPFAQAMVVFWMQCRTRANGRTCKMNSAISSPKNTGIAKVVVTP